jgi:hypothetical protein
MISALFLGIGVVIGWKFANVFNKVWGWVKTQMNNVSE